MSNEQWAVTYEWWAKSCEQWVGTCERWAPHNKISIVIGFISILDKSYFDNCVIKCGY